jgi:hypothetical protein
MASPPEAQTTTNTPGDVPRTNCEPSAVFSRSKVDNEAKPADCLTDFALSPCPRYTVPHTEYFYIAMACTVHELSLPQRLISIITFRPLDISNCA